MEVVQGLTQNLQNIESKISKMDARMDKQDQLIDELSVKMKSNDARFQHKHINRTLKKSSKVDCKLNY